MLAAGSVLAGWLGMPKLWNLFPERSAPSSTGWSRSFAVGGARGRAEGAHHDTRIEWIADGALGRPSRIAGISLARYFYYQQAGDSRDASRAGSGRFYTLLSTSGTWTSSTTSCSSTAWPRAAARAAGRLRQQRGGRRRERRGLADALHFDASPSGGTPGSSTARCACCPSR